MFGELPSALQNCKRLIILDLSENHFSGSVPAWMGDKLSRLEVLRLRSNKLDGHIPHKICALQYLQNLDLAHNNISGAIPKCFSNFSAMVTKAKISDYLASFGFGDEQLHPSASLVLKGRQDEYSSTLGLVTSLDLSANSITGEIPKELGTLTGLLSLNLSWNLLIGNIPDNIGNMESMESIDFSMNQLHGGIPSCFSNLMSYNNLTGQIPTSTQLQSFENSSYMANHLCGPPVSKYCITKGVPTDGGDSEGSIGGIHTIKSWIILVLCIESEREALLKLKKDLIDPSNRLSSWVEEGDCCEWNGVFCNNLTGHVTQLHLDASPFSTPDDDAPFFELEASHRPNLGGTINPSLLRLKHLDSLDLSNNNFSSIQIPDFFGLLGSLTYLNLSHALFHGAIPHNLGNLSKLHYLDLGGNTLMHGAKSLQWVSRLSSLQYLDLSHADLHRASDWLQVTFSLPSLLELHLSDCGLAADPSPISVHSTKSLAVLDLSGNYLSSIPMSIFSFNGLVSIDLSTNSLEGPIPDYLGNMSFLEVVDLSSNSFNSSIPNSLYSLHHLQSLSLGGNYFQGEISSDIGNLSSLIHLDLSDNMLEGRLPISLENLCKLKEMDLFSNEIDQDVSEFLQRLSRCSLDCLEFLNMADNQLSGHLTDQLGKLKI
ncbi:hypothetical protein GQ457_02G033900 [Hibiscus cannabinus]